MKMNIKKHIKLLRQFPIGTVVVTDDGMGHVVGFKYNIVNSILFKQELNKEELIGRTCLEVKLPCGDIRIYNPLRVTLS
jgi:hypothetical protein